MKREDLNHTISLFLILSIIVTGALGYIQSELELRKFYPHRYFAYATLCLAAVHLYFNFRKVWQFLRKKIKRK
ncbi:MAG TPA: hypothetical protein QF468_02075 [Nitrospinota bacterium]|nr:hypothetical protein [Nitrospinota bacterium]